MEQYYQIILSGSFMSTLLALDTSTQLCSVALSHQGQVIEKIVDIDRGHTRHILPIIDQLLSSSGIALNSFDAIALTAGPGSFTGLRVGMGVAQGLAFAADLPIVRVSTLQTLAQGARLNEKPGCDELLLPMLDARMNEVYWGLYCRNNRDEHAGTKQKIVRELASDRVSKPEQIRDALNAVLESLGGRVEDVAGLGDGWHCTDQIKAEIGILDLEARPMARDIIPLAQEKLSSGQMFKPEALEPYYIRDKIHWKKRERLR